MEKSIVGSIGLRCMVEKMRFEKAYSIAERVMKLLKPFCDRIEIAGSLRREKEEVKDIEIVAIPKSNREGWIRLEDLLDEIIKSIEDV